MKSRRILFILWVLFLVLLMAWGLRAAHIGAGRHRETERYVRAAEEIIYGVCGVF